MDIRIELKHITSVLRKYGFDHLREYLAIETLKKQTGQDYFSWIDVQNLTQCATEKRWLGIFNDLATMGVAVRTGSSVTTRKKISKDWIKYCQEHYLDFHLDLQPQGGHIYLLDTGIFERLTNKEHFREFIYISLLGLFHKAKSLSRCFITELTGLSKYLQLKIEKKNTEYVQVKPNYQPIDNYEVDYNTMKLKNGEHNSPCFNGYVDRTLSECFLTSREKSNCKIIQTGNTYVVNNKITPIIKEKHIVKIKELKIKNKNSHGIQEMKQMSEASVNSKISFNDASLVMDLDNDKDNRQAFLHYVTTLNMGRIGFKKLKTFFNDFKNIVALTAEGQLKSINRCVKTQPTTKWHKTAYSV